MVSNFTNNLNSCGREGGGDSTWSCATLSLPDLKECNIIGVVKTMIYMIGFRKTGFPRRVERDVKGQETDVTDWNACDEILDLL
jgi:hypothetical protein